MAKIPLEPECPHVLIVEGYSDLHFYAAFLKHLGRFDGVFFQVFHGKSNILNRAMLRTFINEDRLTKKRSIGILIDADENPSGTAQAIRDHLFAITQREVDEGHWQEGAQGESRLGFFVAPSAATAGEVETLAWDAFPADEKHGGMKTAVGDYFGKMAALGWTPQSPDKARVGAYLAAAYDEDPRLGPGAREGKFPFDSPGFARLRTFLEVLPPSA